MGMPNDAGGNSERGNMLQGTYGTRNIFEVGPA